MRCLDDAVADTLTMPLNTLTTDDHMPIGMSVTSTGVGCNFLTITVSTPLSNRAVMPPMSALSGNCKRAAHARQNPARQIHFTNSRTRCPDHGEHFSFRRN